MLAKNELSEDEKKGWDRFVLEQDGPFLQSWEWGEFQKAVGRQVFFLKDDPSAFSEWGNWQALIIRHGLPLGKSYLYCPRGPIINPKNKVFTQTGIEQNILNFFVEINKLAEKEKGIFNRIDPQGFISEENLRKLGFIRSLKNVQPSRTILLDLNLSEEGLIANMHEKTRYNIGLASRKGIIVEKREYNDKDFDDFWQLLNRTARRQKISIFGKEYYRKQLQVKSERFRNWLFIAEYQGKAIAANLLNIFGTTATYLHGGSDNEYRALMAPHLLQWEQIKYAKQAGCKIYDFWGVDEKKWPGVTRFKNGFSGKEVQYIGTFDLILKQAWYSAYFLAKNILR